MKHIHSTLFTVLILLSASFPVFADHTVTVTGSNGTTSITVPDEVYTIYLANQTAIDSAVSKYSTSEISSVASQLTSAYANLSSYGITTVTPITTAKNGLNDFSDVLSDVLPNSQTQQNVWADSWIGTILPFPHFGFGINAGASKLDISSLKSTASALGIKVGDVRDSYALPTITADMRIGGFILPFDLGFTFSSIDSSKIGALDSAIDPVSFEFFTIGGDLRYAVIKGLPFDTKVSVGGGFYYTKGNVDVKNSNADAKLDFNSTTLFLNSQVSAKFLLLRPFAGGRLLFTKTDVDWKVNAQWDKIYSSSLLADAEAWGLLPTSFSGSSNSSFGDHIRPQLYAGLGIDILVIDITGSVCYDFVSQIPSGAVSVRFSL